MIVVFPDDPLSYSLSIFGAMKRQHRAKSQWLLCTINHCCQTSVTNEKSGLQINATSEKSAIQCKEDNGKKLTLHQEVHYLLKKNNDIHRGQCSRMAQSKRAGPLTQRSKGRNLALLKYSLFVRDLI